MKYRKNLQQTDFLKQVAHNNKNHSQLMSSRWEDDTNSAQLLEKAREFERENHRLSMQISLLQHELNSSRRSPLAPVAMRVKRPAALPTS